MRILLYQNWFLGKDTIILINIIIFAHPCVPRRWNNIDKDFIGKRRLHTLTSWALKFPHLLSYSRTYSSRCLRWLAFRLMYFRVSIREYCVFIQSGEDSADCLFSVARPWKASKPGAGKCSCPRLFYFKSNAESVGAIGMTQPWTRLNLRIR